MFLRDMAAFAALKPSITRYFFVGYVPEKWWGVGAELEKSLEKWRFWG